MLRRSLFTCPYLFRAMAMHSSGPSTLLAACSNQTLERTGLSYLPAWPERPSQALQLAHYAKARRTAEGAQQAGGSSSQDLDIHAYESAMQKSVSHLQSILQGLSTGRATGGMLDAIRVEAYSDRIPLKGLASVSVRDRQTLAVAVYDESILAAVEKGIRLSDLGLNPSIQEKEILVHIPRLTKETVAAMQKLMRKEGESAKVSVRSIRRDFLDAVKKISSEDERKREEKKVQALTEKYIREVDSELSRKESELSTAL